MILTGLAGQLKDLEEELGKQLLVRGKKITLTEDGMLLRKRAEELVGADVSDYDSIKLPIKDTWGVLMHKDAPLAEKESICPEDLWDEPLIISHQNGPSGKRFFESDAGSDSRKIKTTPFLCIEKGPLLFIQLCFSTKE